MEIYGPTARASEAYKSRMQLQLHASVFEEVYRRFGRREQALCDPVHFLYEYPDVERREVVGLISSCLAYGRVAQICKSVSNVLDRLELSTRAIDDISDASIRRRLGGFKHRFTTGGQLADMLIGVKRVRREFGSLENVVCDGIGDSHGEGSIVPGMARVVDEISRLSRARLGHLLPHPAGHSACKRLNLFMRWMVRHDEVDPGGWGRISTRLLLVPMDVHMHRLGVLLGLTKCRSTNLSCSAEVTAGFAAVNPADPVKYDFALTRMSIVDPQGIQALVNME